MLSNVAVDPSVLRNDAHSASYFTLSRSMGDAEKIIDFCIPCNPYFPTPDMFARLAENLPEILKYYPSDSSLITKKLTRLLNLHPQTVTMANGSTELITWMDHLLIKESLAVPIPTFGRWTDQPLETGKRVDMYLLQESDNFALDLDAYVKFIRTRGSRVAVLCNPNNPDGGYVTRRDVVRFMDELSDLDLVVIDESFIDFVDVERYTSVAADAAIRSNVVVLKSLGKNFGLHGIRFGYSVANPALTATLAKALPKWNLNSLAEAVVYMLEDHQADYQLSLRLLARDRLQMTAMLRDVPGLTVFPSDGNFILVKIPPTWGGVELRDYLVSQYGVYIRECGNKLGMTSDFLRLVVRPQEDVEQLVEGLLNYGRTRPESASAADPLPYPSPEPMAPPSVEPVAYAAPEPAAYPAPVPFPSPGPSPQPSVEPAAYPDTGPLPYRSRRAQRYDQAPQEPSQRYEEVPRQPAERYDVERYEQVARQQAAQRYEEAPRQPAEQRYDAGTYDDVRYEEVAQPAERYDTERYDAQRYDTQRYDAQRYDAQRPDAHRLDAHRLDAQRPDAHRYDAQQRYDGEHYGTEHYGTEHYGTEHYDPERYEETARQQPAERYPEVPRRPPPERYNPKQWQDVLMYGSRA